MRLLRLQLDGVRSHEHLDLDLAATDAAAILGRNGAGKSTILQSVDWALGGAPPGAGAEDLLRDGAHRMEVVLDVEQAGRRYRVTRGRDRGKGGWLLLDELDADGQVARSLSSRTIAETQERIAEQVTGMTPEAFRATVYAPQGEAGMLASLPPGRRKELLGALLGLDRYEAWRATAAGEAREARGRLDAHRAQLDRLRADVERQEADLELAEELRVRVAAAESTARDAESAIDAAIEAERIRGDVQRRAALVGQMEALKRRAERAGTVRQRRAELEDRLAAQTASRERLASLEREHLEQLRAGAAVVAERREAEAQVRVSERARDDAERLRDERTATATAARAKTGDAQHALDALDAQDPRCGDCGQPVADDALNQARAAAGGRLDRALVAWRDAGQAEGEAERTLTYQTDESRRAADALAALPRDPPPPDTAELLSAREEVAALDQATGELAGLEPPEDVEALRGEYRTLKAEVDGLPTEAPAGPTVAQAREHAAAAAAALRQAEGAQARHGERQAHISRLRAEHARLLSEDGSLERQADALSLVARGLSRDGVPALILDNAVGAVETEANALLDQLGMPMRLRLETQRTSKRGSASETLDIVVDYGADERPLAQLSGGERYRVHIALRLGLAAVLADTGVRCDVLLVDEPTDLDRDGMRVLGEMLAAAPQQALVVSHDDELADALPSRLVVTREDHGPSRVVMR